MLIQSRQFIYTHAKPRYLPSLAPYLPILQLHAFILKSLLSGAFDKLTKLLRDFSSIVSRVDETVTAVYEKIQGECSG